MGKETSFSFLLVRFFIGRILKEGNFRLFRCRPDSFGGAEKNKKRSRRPLEYGVFPHNRRKFPAWGNIFFPDDKRPFKCRLSCSDKVHAANCLKRAADFGIEHMFFFEGKEKPGGNSEGRKNGRRIKGENSPEDHGALHHGGSFNHRKQAESRPLRPKGWRKRWKERKGTKKDRNMHQRKFYL